MIDKNKTNSMALITGGTKGIGLAICQKLSFQGYDIITCSRHEEDLDQLKKDLTPSPGRVITMVADLSQMGQVKEFISFVKSQTGHLDLLVNNAGLFIPGEILKEDDGQLELMMSTNVYSAYHLTRGVLPLLRKGTKPHIFNMCSIASKIAYPNGGSYSISKFALLGFSKVLREELKTQGIRVTAILPGATWSASWQGVDLPDSRLMQPQDIAHLLWSAYELGPSADVEEILVRPQLGDL
jgi:NADP-dependent 3-hydroxy acid dehydrogenase YdfG